MKMSCVRRVTTFVICTNKFLEINKTKMNYWIGTGIGLYSNTYKSKNKHFISNKLIVNRYVYGKSINLQAK